MTPQKALITGITGQDGSFLAELLLQKGYEVHGIVRHVALEDPVHRLWRIHHLMDQIHLHSASLESYPSLFRVVEHVMPDECYHLAAQTYVSYSFEDEFSTINTNLNGTHFILSTLKELAPKCKFYFATSSEMFGQAKVCPQSETTPFHPRSPYGVSKVAGYYMAEHYRDNYDIFACCGIAYNHESERRGFEFVSRKITSTVARIKYGLAKELRLGNTAARRDWGYAPEYVRAMWLMLQQPQPGDYVIATEEVHSVQEFLEMAFQMVELDWKDWVTLDPRLYRPAEGLDLCGDASKAHKVLGWKNQTSFQDLVRIMVDGDCQRIAESGSRLVR